MPVISPFVLLLFFPPLLKKVGKDEKTECSENSRHYYCAACMAPVILSFHLCFLLYWQMVVIRQYGNTVVKIVFTDFFPPLWYLWPDDRLESVVVLNRGPICQCCMSQEANMCHMGMMFCRDAECLSAVVYSWCAYFSVAPKCWYMTRVKNLINQLKVHQLFENITFGKKPFFFPASGFSNKDFQLFCIMII